MYPAKLRDDLRRSGTRRGTRLVPLDRARPMSLLRRRENQMYASPRDLLTPASLRLYKLKNLIESCIRLYAAVIAAEIRGA